jgi:hypothetical protein
LISAGRPIPSSVQARGLLDIGSNVTAVAPSVLKQLEIRTTSTRRTQTASGKAQVRLFRISLSILDPAQANRPWLTFPSVPVMELPIELADLDVLVGLDILLKCKLSLDGPARQFSLDR